MEHMENIENGLNIMPTVDVDMNFGDEKFDDDDRFN